jgi:hypothetical protein
MLSNQCSETPRYGSLELERWVTKKREIQNIHYTSVKDSERWSIWMTRRDKWYERTGVWVYHTGGKMEMEMVAAWMEEHETCFIVSRNHRSTRHPHRRSSRLG